jgi:nitroimidazol reductase NimA-like FMN-containing flavoprotein (pyridoxamine 5'-phosphate oxidase superfamily)
MTETAHDSRELTRGECLALLPTAPFGRLVFVDGAMPAVIPVSFLLDHAGIVLRTAAGSSIDRIADGSRVAVQADDVDVARRTGWSVTVVGRARTPRDAVELERLAALPLQPWVTGERTAFVVVEVDVLTGRRIGGSAVLPGRV